MDRQRVLKKIGILLFDDVELLDFAGPMQVFSALAALYPNLGVEVYNLGLTESIVVAKSKLQINGLYTLDSWTDRLDLFLIPGGQGTRAIIKSKEQMAAIQHILSLSEISSTVCTGSLVLAKTGKLSDKKATTHFAAIDLLQKIDNTIIVDRDKRYHDHGDIVVSEGVSAGIDMSLYLVAKYHGQEKADHVRKYIEYFPEVA